MMGQHSWYLLAEDLKLHAENNIVYLIKCKLKNKRWNPRIDSSKMTKKHLSIYHNMWSSEFTIQNNMLEKYSTNT